GLGGKSIYEFGDPVAGSQLRYNADYGAMLVEASEWQIVFRFITRTGAIIDTYILNKPATPTPEFTVTPTSTSTNIPTMTVTPVTYIITGNTGIGSVTL